MKKVTMTFIVSDDVADDALNEMTWGNMSNAAHILNKNCEESDYGIEDYKDIKIMAKKFKIITKDLPDGDKPKYKDFENFDDAFSYCFKKARKEQCDKVELSERTDDSMLNARLCPIAEFYHW